nr:MAG TPA: hypothetical protein [Caudoviricetes sp.]
MRLAKYIVRTFTYNVKRCFILPYFTTRNI